MKRITIKDIAKLLQVAPSTVSRALADHPDISQSTKDAVKTLAKELGYTPHYFAVNFRKKHSGLIALILPEIQMFFFPEVIRGLEEKIRGKGFSLIVLHSNNSLELESENIDLCMQYPVDGVILSLTSETKNLDHLNQLLKLDVPIVLYDRIIPNDLTSTLTIDDESAVFEAINFLIKRGHQHIIGLFGDENLYITKERLKGFERAFTHSDLPVNEQLILHTKHLQEISTKLKAILQTSLKPTAIFAMSDELLVKLKPVLMELNLRVPEDIAIICISEGYLPNFSFPKITHIRHSGYEVGEKAGDMLLELINNKSVKRLNHQMPLHLILNSSV